MVKIAALGMPKEAYSEFPKAANRAYPKFFKNFRFLYNIRSNVNNITAIVDHYSVKEPKVHLGAKPDIWTELCFIDNISEAAGILL